jgi:hypothetical protein
MKSFTDALARKWEFSLTIGAADRIRKAKQIDLLDPLKGDVPLLTAIHADCYLLADVLWLLVEPAAAKLGVDQEGFFSAIGGAESQASYEAFVEEWMDFFRSRNRPDAAAAIAAHRAAVIRAIGTKTKIVELATARIEETMTAAERRGLGAMSGALPDSSVSTPEN